MAACSRMMAPTCLQQAGPEGWTARHKFTAVIETAALNESACPARSRRAPSTAESVDPTPQQITAWRRACECATDWANERSQQQAAVDREVRSLKRELQRKEKALAPATAPCDCARDRLRAG